MTSPYYVPSGRVPIASLPVALAFLAATVPAAWLYAWSLVHAALVFKPLCTAVFALYLGYLGRRAIIHGKVRNPGWAAGTGMAIGAAGLYLHWVAYTGMTTFQTTPFAAATWLAEAWLLLSLPRALGRMRATRLFCETSNAWAARADAPEHFACFAATDQTVAMLEQYPHKLADMLKPLRETVSRNRSDIEVFGCPGGDTWVTIWNVAVELADGKTREFRDRLVENLRVPGFDCVALAGRLAAVDLGAGRDDAGPGRPAPAELEAALGHIGDECHEPALAAALPYTAAADVQLRMDALRLCGLASSRLQRWLDAADHWERLFADEPNALNALQTASNAVMAGDAARGAAWLERARASNAASRVLSDIELTAGYLTALKNTGRMADAMPYLDDIKAVYVRLGITDPAFLHVRECPGFPAFLEESAPIVRANHDRDGERRWYAAMLPHLDDDGQATLQDWLDRRFVPACRPRR